MKNIILVGIVAGLAGAGAYLAINKNKIPTSVTLTGLSSVSVNSPTDYTATVMQNTAPVSGVIVVFRTSTATIGTVITNTSGNATISLSFTSTGTETIYAESNGVKSSSLTITVSSSSTPPPSGCASCSDCPTGQNCINGTCEELIPASITMPVTYYPHTAYYEILGMNNNAIYETYMLLSFPNNKTYCPPTVLNGQPISDTFGLEINGQVVDAAGHGVSGVHVSFSIAGAGAWLAGTNGEFSGTTQVSLQNNASITDCEGNFTVTITVVINVSYNNSAFYTDFGTSYFSIPIPTVTLTVSSGSLASVETIITFNDFIGATRCNYVDGVLA